MRFFWLILLMASAWSSPSVAGGHHEASAGAVVTSGNAQTSSVSLKHRSEFSWSIHRLFLQADFLSASRQGVETALVWSLGARIQRELGPRLSLFLGQKVEGNPFQNILQRYSSDFGGGDSILKNEAWGVRVEGGYRFARENYPYGFQNLSFVRLYSECERKFSESVSLLWWLEYLPNLTEWQAYQLNSELSMKALLSEIFSVRSGYVARYYHLPPAGTRFPLDTAFTTAIVAAF